MHDANILEWVIEIHDEHNTNTLRMSIASLLLLDIILRRVVLLDSRVSFPISVPSKSDKIEMFRNDVIITCSISCLNSHRKLVRRHIVLIHSKWNRKSKSFLNHTIYRFWWPPEWFEWNCSNEVELNVRCKMTVI